jgi:hypothetical protein
MLAYATHAYLIRTLSADALICCNAVRTLYSRFTLFSHAFLSFLMLYACYAVLLAFFFKRALMLYARSVHVLLMLYARYALVQFSKSFSALTLTKLLYSCSFTLTKLLYACSFLGFGML